MSASKFNPLTFGNRETYLEFRKEWKEEYLQISQAIRSTKLEIKTEARQNGYASYGLQLRLQHDQRIANILLETLTEAKQKAQQQYLEQKESCNVCN